METISTPCLCGCGQLVEQSSTKPKKYLDDAHRKSHSRRNKEALAASNRTMGGSQTLQAKAVNTLIGSNGVDYSDPYKVMPAHLACYMPVQSHQTKEQMLALEASIHHRKTPATSQEVQEPKPF
jgi:hypothetical protein